MKTKLKSYLLSIIGIVLVAYSLYSMFTMNFNMGIVFCLILGVVFIALGIIIRFFIRLKWLASVFAGACACVLVFSCFLGIYGSVDNVKNDEDVLIILGCAVEGEKLSTQLKSRLDRALEYAKENEDALIVCAGGKGKGEDISEAEAMQKYLIENGVLPDRIIIEDESVSTKTNLENAKKKFEGGFEGEYTVALITSDYHVFRAEKEAEKIFDNVTHAHSDIELSTVPVRYIRECAAIVKNLIFGK